LVVVVVAVVVVCCLLSKEASARKIFPSFEITALLLEDVCDRRREIKLGLELKYNNTCNNNNIITIVLLD